MKYIFSFLFFSIGFNVLQAQCSDIFISEYVEGWSNNKALELYNPTANTIDLSAYSIARYSNGSIQPSAPLQLSGTILPYSTYVLGLDKRDPNGTGFDAPMWDGYYTFTDTLCPETMGQEITIYNAENDLQSQINLWANGIYYSGSDPVEALLYPQIMFFNGNDAIVMSLLGGGPVDVFGQVGFDPGAAWTDGSGNYWTKDHSLIRKSSVQSGFMSNPNSFDPTLEWDSLPVNTFINLGSHNCICDPNYTGPNVYGCTNASAINYNSSATIDDNSCEYNNCGPFSTIMDHANLFNIYPNPSSNGELNISSNSNIDCVAIYNAVGTVVFSKNIINENNVHVDLGDKKGVFFISIIDINGVTTKSVLMQ